jgi:hypothetical protein
MGGYFCAAGHLPLRVEVEKVLGDRPRLLDLD